MFIICACVYSVGAVFYWIFSESKLQPWAISENKPKKAEHLKDHMSNESLTEEKINPETEVLELKTKF